LYQDSDAAGSSKSSLLLTDSAKLLYNVAQRAVDDGLSFLTHNVPIPSYRHRPFVRVCIRAPVLVLRFAYPHVTSNY
jgi:hypothetical protein